MARRKPTKVGEVATKFTTTPVPVYLAPDQTFQAEVNGQRIEAKSFDALVVLVRQAAQAAAAFEWVSVIEISFNPYSVLLPGSAAPPTAGAANIEFSFTRYWLAKGAGTMMLKCDWDEPEATRLAHPQRMHWPEPGFKLPHTMPTQYNYTTKYRHYLPYSQALWDVLVELQMGLQRLGEHLQPLLGQQAEQHVHLLQRMAAYAGGDEVQQYRDTHQRGTAYSWRGPHPQTAADMDLEKVVPPPANGVASR